MTEYDLPEQVEILKKADEATLEEINREAELFLQAQLTASLAADQRALVYGSILGAVLAVLIGGVASLAANNVAVGQLLVVIIPMSGCFVVSLIFALTAGRPTEFDVAGNNPRRWLEDIELGQSMRDSLAEMAALNSAAIEANNDRMDAAYGHMKTALWWGLAGLVIGLVTLLFIVSFPTDAILGSASPSA